MIALAIAAGVGVALAVSLVRLFLGPTLYDRMLAANAAVLMAALVCAAFAVLAGRSEWADTAFALVFGVFVASAAAMKFFRLRTFQPSLMRGERDVR